MLIRRDRLLSKLRSLSWTNRTAGPESAASPNTETSTMADNEQLPTQKQFVDRRIAELLASAMGEKPEVDEWTVKALLQLPQDIGTT